MTFRQFLCTRGMVKAISTVVATAALVVIAPDSLSAQILAPKRGFADTGASYNYLQALNAGWYYRWGSDKANIGNYDAEFVPMLWGGWAANQSTIDKIINYGDVNWVLGFNEPEREDQANMTVSQAISAWQTLDAGFDGTGIKLISPGISDTSGGQQWLADFMSQANSQGLQVDAVAFHWYGASTPDNPAGAASSFLSRVDSYHNSYGLPVWITEFAIHDWGGNYTDEEVRAANAAFLDIVVPALESRSYVAGYAFYNWFGDSKLVEGSPLKPTNVGEEYVGVIENGQAYDFTGTDLGEHVAYLKGGELTRSGATGTVRYINALGGVNTISGSSDWGLNGGTNWIRVQPGTTLRKTGGNQIVLSGANVANEGVIEVVEGVLRLEYYPSISGSGELRINQGGTLSLHGSRGDTAVTMNFDTELRGGTISASAEMVDGVILTNGSVLMGDGTVTNDLTVQSGAVIRVGDAGMTSPARFMIDDFEGYATGDLRDVASPPWTAHEGTGFADVESDSGNQVLTYGWSDNFRGTSREMPEDGSIDDSEQATFFFRFNSKSDDPDHSFGLGDQADTGTVVFSDYEAQIRIMEGTTANTIAIDARDGGGFSGNLETGLALNTWYNLWMVVDQVTDTYDVYLNTGTADATTADKLNTTPLAFRNGTTGALDKILALAGGGSISNAVRIDDLVYLHGEDLTNPMGGFDPGLLIESATLMVSGDLTLSPGALLELDIYDPSYVDLVDITGNLTAGGTLSVSLTDGAPAPQLGDTFDILDFASASGAFGTVSLPSLDVGLMWDTSGLLTTGILEVVSSLTGDLDGDGFVGITDLNVVLGNWNQSVAAGDLGQGDPSGDGFVGIEDLNVVLGNWNAGTPPILNAIIPEPSSVLLMLGGLVLASGRVIRS